VNVPVGGGVPVWVRVKVTVAVNVTVGVGVPVRVKVMVQVLPGYPQGVFVDVAMDPAGRGSTKYVLLQANGKNNSEETMSKDGRSSSFGRLKMVPTGHS
jgi:hypothetical protein